MTLTLFFADLIFGTNFSLPNKIFEHLVIIFYETIMTYDITNQLKTQLLKLNFLKYLFDLKFNFMIKLNFIKTIYIWC